MKPFVSDPDFTLWHGDALEVLRTLPSRSVRCAVTSPPYWGLRDYGAAGQLGLESTPAEYVAALVAVLGEVRRVLADDGTLWLNLGDSYANPAGGDPRTGFNSRYFGTDIIPGKQAAAAGQFPLLDRRADLRAKNLVGIPWRVAFALQEDGWYLRSDIIWSKPNPMPESVTDRPTKAHEYVFLLAKQTRYWFDAAAIREANTSPEQATHNARYAKVYDAHTARVERGDGIQPGNKNNIGIHARGGRTIGRNVRSVWEIATQPYPEAHFATFPQELARRCILAGCPAGGVVLDPFGGSGTTAFVARKHGRRATLIELNADYCTLAAARLGQQSLLTTGDCGAVASEETPRSGVAGLVEGSQ